MANDPAARVGGSDVVAGRGDLIRGGRGREGADRREALEFASADDIAAVATGCRFRDCAHEPGCARPFVRGRSLTSGWVRGGRCAMSWLRAVVDAESQVPAGRRAQGAMPAMADTRS